MEIEEQKIDLLDIAGNFRSNGRVRNVFPYGSGHINDTYKVLTGEQNYLLQRVNQQVFMDVRGLTSNLIRVTNYLSDLLVDDSAGMKILNTIRTINGTYFFIDDETNFWRMFDFMEGGKSYDRAENTELAEEGGKAYGWFIKSLNKFQVNVLIETIPNFHNAEARLDNFRKAIAQNRKNRAEGVSYEIDFIEQRANDMLGIHQLGAEGKIPLRVTHNDTKINNVLFDEADKAISVIDLDTVMPGYVHFDFGDAIRTFTNSANEDESSLDKIFMNFDFFKAFTKGFLSETLAILSEEEIRHLAFSAKYITWEQSARFLTDYLNGDVYYKIAFPEHNLIRTKAQLKLLQSMEEQFEAMEKVVLEIAGL